MLTGSYGIGNVEFLMQPTSGRWLPNSPVGITGDGHYIYPAVKQFEIRWVVNTPAEFYQINNFYKLVEGATGTVVVALPKWGANTYTFHNYSGCTLGEPEINQYFAAHHTEVLLIVGNIRT